jgi:hypothetical protein
MVMGLQAPFLMSFCVVAASWREVRASRGVLAGSKFWDATARRENDSAERRDMSAKGRRGLVDWTDAGRADMRGRKMRAAAVDLMVKGVDYDSEICTRR